MIFRVFIRTSTSHVVKRLRLTSASKDNICLKKLIYLNKVLVYAKTLCIFNKIGLFYKKKIFSGTRNNAHAVFFRIYTKRSVMSMYFIRFSQQTAIISLE